MVKKVEDIDDVLSSDEENEGNIKENKSSISITQQQQRQQPKQSSSKQSSSKQHQQQHQQHHQQRQQQQQHHQQQLQPLTLPIQEVDESKSKEKTTKTLSILNNQHLIQTKKPKKILKRAPSDASPRVIVSHDKHKSNNNTQIENANVFERNPLERLCEVMTQWNILNDVISGNNYNNQEDNALLSSSTTVVTIPTLFESCTEYYKTWEPLLTEEIKANICSNLTHNTRNASKTGRLIIGNSLLIYFLLHTLITIIIIGEGGENNFRSALTKLLGSYDDKIDDIPRSSSTSSLQEMREPELLQNMDLILLSLKPFKLPLNESNIRLQSPSDLKSTMLAIVTSTSSGGRGRDSGASIQIMTLRKNWEYINVTYKNEIAESKDKKLKKDGAVKMNYIIIDSLISRWREFMALSEIMNINLKEAVVYGNVEMNMQPSPGEEIRLPTKTEGWPEIKDLPLKFFKVLRNKFNESQLLAIRMACRDQNKITLVQGPPGTGKTTTIIGILNAIHLREYNRYYKACIDELIGAHGMQCRHSRDIKPWTKFVSSLSKKKPHILVVAPSNVAVDNIVQRIMEKEFYDGSGGKYKPDMLRIGAGKTANVQAVSLEDKMEKEQLSFLDDSNRIRAQSAAQRDIVEIIEQIKLFQSYLVNLSLAYKAYNLPENWELRVDPATAAPYWVDHLLQTTSTSPPDPSLFTNRPRSFYKLETLPEYQLYGQQVTQCLEKLDRLNLLLTRCRAKTNPQEFGGYSEARQVVETSIIDEAHLLCTTINSAGHPSLESTEFQIVVIDEACQCLEPSVLIALRRGCKQCIMVGDPQQLPATIFAESNKKTGFEISMFERLMKAGLQLVLLDTQYRMHPAINDFPSAAFYDSRIRNGSNVQKENYSPSHLNSYFLPFLFFDLQSSREEYKNKSCSNNEEIVMCLNLLETLILEARASNVTLGSVGIITPYSDQIQEMKKVLSEKGYFKNANTLFIAKAGVNVKMPDVELNTVDGFQGREKDIIIMSCVRSNDNGTVGFLADSRRMNVAITRARFGLYIVGNVNTLRHNPTWYSLIKSAQDRSLLVHVPSSTTPIMPLLRQLYSFRTVYNDSIASSVHTYESDSILCAHVSKKRKSENGSIETSIIYEKEEGEEEGEV